MAGNMNFGTTSLARTIFFNVLVLFVLTNLLYWLIPVGGAISRIYKTSFLETLARVMPPAYASSDAAWIKRHWQELNQGHHVYKSYVGWRHAPFRGETINVEGPHLQRRTANEKTPADTKVYFFGGSTMWGIGVRDAETIPSQFAAITGLRSENFGEKGWVAHQSLMLLIQLLQAGHRPDLVVFYDGVNDALEKCRSEISAEAHQKEREFDTVLRNSSRNDSFSHFLAPVVTLAARANDRLGLLQTGAEWYECHRNPQKVEAIAENLMRDWQLAKQLVEGRGGRFIGILQPTPFASRTRLDHLQLSSYVGAQYAAVYPIMRGRIARGGEFHDFVSVLDRDEHLYVDWCHLAPKGNRYIAEKIAEIVAPLGLKR
jgi:hypothetical protein